MPQIWTVQNCSDHDPGSLRDIIENPVKAQSGDTVDLSQLPALCAETNSVITLTTGQIDITQDDLKVIGPSPDAGTVTVSAGGISRIFSHARYSGTLAIEKLTISNGYHHAAYAYGGCIFTNTNVSLTEVSVTNCKASSTTGTALGGAIYAADAVLFSSSVSNNSAIASADVAQGGGIKAGHVISKYTSIDHNIAQSGTGEGDGGGLSVSRAGIYHSTIALNSADYGSALRCSCSDTHISNSTISGNTGRFASVILFAGASVGEHSISNSTIVYNYASLDHAGVVFFAGNPGPSFVLHSSIIAMNTMASSHIPSDLYVHMAAGVLEGADNLVIASHAIPPSVIPPGVITVTTDPKIGPLQHNGSRMLTHALLPGSPALGVGNHTMSFPIYDPNTHDQRGSGYPRTTLIGANVTTDIGAVQFDEIFPDGFD